MCNKWLQVISKNKFNVLLVLLIYLSFWLYITNKELEKRLISCEIVPQQKCVQKSQDKFIGLIKSLNNVLKSHNEYWNFMSSLIASKDVSTAGSIVLEEKHLQVLNDMNNVLSVDLENHYSQLKNISEINFSHLSDVIQKNIYDLQNPPQSECKNRKFLLVKITPFGFGSHADVLTKFLKFGYFTNSTVILKDFLTNYLKHSKYKWDHYITPISETCQPNASVSYKGTHFNLRKVDGDLPNDEIGRLVASVHPNPKLFWYSQFAKYVMRPNKLIANDLEKSIINCKFTHPIVGIHIRRGDKLIREAKYHSNDEYMFYVRNFYDKLSLKGYNGEKNVFVATDDSSAINELRKAYTDYNFIDKECFVSTDKYETRGDNQRDYPNLEYIILDIHFLSMCDYIVCTLSSNVGRVAYDLMAATKNEFPFGHSLDLPWFIGGNENYNYHRFRYQHLTTSTNGEALKFSANDSVREKFFESELLPKNKTKDIFVECITNSRESFQCPLYKMEEIRVYSKG